LETAPARPSLTRTIYVVAVGVFLASCVFVASMMVLSFPLGLLAFREAAGDRMASRLTSVPVLVLDVALRLPLSPTFSEFFVILWALYLGFFLLLWVGPKVPPHRVFGRCKVNGLDAVFESSLFTVIAALGALLVVTSVIEVLQESVGISTGDLSGTDRLIRFLSIVYAPLVEEVGFRLVLVGGTGVLIAALLGAGRYSMLALWNPGEVVKRHLRETVRPGASWTLAAAAVVSALIFGFSHLAANSGWETGKVTTASLTGLVLAWLYVKYGLAAAVMTHWSFNYFLQVFYVVGQDPGLGFLYTGAFMAVTFSGIFATALLAARLVSAFVRKGRHST